MTTRRILLLPALGLALVAAGCGDDDKNSEPAASSTPTQTTQPQDPVKPAPEEAPAGGEDAVKQTIITWTFEGDCETMTDKFLESQAFVGDNRTERCKYFEDSFQKPQYKESDVKFRKVTVTGNKAVVTVGSDIANVEADYHLVSEGGKWKIDEVDLG